MKESNATATVPTGEAFDALFDRVTKLEEQFALLELVLDNVWVPWQDAARKVRLVTLSGMKSLSKKGKLEMRIKPGTTSSYEFSLLSVLKYLKDGRRKS